MFVIAVIVLILIIAGGLFFMKSKPKPQDGPSTSATEPVQPAPPENEIEPIFNTLLKLNIMMRKDIEFPVEIIEEIESIVDDLMVVIPAMIDRYPGETLTYEIKKIGREHLYKTVKEYLDLSEESRENQAAVFRQTIDSLKEIANRSRDIVEKNETAEFKTMANFLSGKFS